MIRDRGNIKWNSLMLPEHVKMLREWAQEDTWDEKKELDEQKLEQLNEVAEEAMKLGKEVNITYFSHHHTQQLSGRIHCFDPMKKEFRIVARSGRVHHISIEQIEHIGIIG
ncbi:YolD-like family protein [Siminovitchia sp. 179-K 8D1 HS]|uniref:YolD-like family protein n=1 Tax=Siminovitchia sp. 179-K 8D1 HS TaxID=3142385 RepID=UPI0039A035A5